MEVFFVRHGESVANLLNETSVPETPLSERGIADAINAGKLLKGKFDRVFVSPYLRARQTQQYALPDANAEVVDCIHELYLGDAEGYPYAQLFEKFPLFSYHCEVDDFSDYNGETYDQLRQRVRSFMQILQSTNAGRIVVFSHAGFILTFFDEVMQRKEKPGRNIRCDNGSVSLFIFDGEKWEVGAFNLTHNLLNA